MNIRCTFAESSIGINKLLLTMIKSYISVLALMALLACQQNQHTTVEETTETSVSDDTATLVDSLLYARHHHETTDILSRHWPDLTREQAIEIQLAMLNRELAAGARLVGWKMGGTITDDSTKYDPLFGYILDRNIIAEDSTVVAENFPGGHVMVEGEVGFILSKDFPEGAASVEALKEGIDHAVSAVEFAQATAVARPGDASPLPINYVLAAGMGQAGTLIGSGTMDVDQLDVENETVKCFINGKVAAEGRSAKVYGGPLNALYSLVNMLPRYGTYLKKGDVVITGSLYDNPTIDSTSDVRLEYSNLGTIHFSMK